MHTTLKIFGKLLKTDEHELEIRRAIKDLHAMNDRDLNDIGLSRGMIEHAVRNGNSRNYNAPTQRAA